jgi:hypothetical protein
MHRSEYDFDVCSGTAMPPPPLPAHLTRPQPSATEPTGAPAHMGPSLDPAPAAADRVEPA